MRLRLRGRISPASLNGTSATRLGRLRPHVLRRMFWDTPGVGRAHPEPVVRFRSQEQDPPASVRPAMEQLKHGRPATRDDGSMVTVLVALGSIVCGAVLGYLARLHEFRREHRLLIYSNFVAEFLAAAHLGAALSSAHLQLGETMRNTEYEGRLRPLWDQWTEAQRGFERTAAQLRMIGSGDACREAAKLEDFIQANVLNAPPFAPTGNTDDWGPAIRKGPSEVSRQAGELARAYATALSGDVARVAWR